MSVALLFPKSGSLVPGGTAIVAVFERTPVAAPLITAVSVKIAVPPTGRFTEAAMLPPPDSGFQTSPLPIGFPDPQIVPAQ